ncbi:hypothetical protein E4U55_007201 [Claviceps digitariae]|nr:hypothetical protein E4U55_007201 [Claviceps digitariae]
MPVPVPGPVIANRLASHCLASHRIAYANLFGFSRTSAVPLHCRLYCKAKTTTTSFTTTTITIGSSKLTPPATPANSSKPAIPLVNLPQPPPPPKIAAMASALPPTELAKQQAAYQAVEDHLLPSYKLVGIGSGSTVVYVVEAIKSKGPEFYASMTFVPTGSQSKGLIKAAGLNMCYVDERPLVGGQPVAIDVAFDGADEVDEQLNLIKGGGACLFQEKLVATAARKFIAVADSRKQSPRLCTKWKTIPIEVLPLAAPDVLRRLRAMGSPSPVVRSGLPSKAGECVTDNGMWIIDAPFSPLLLPKDLASAQDGSSSGSGGSWEVQALADELIRIPGVVEIGLFYGFNGTEAAAMGRELQAQKPVAAYFGMPDGRVQVQNA